ncbi:MAG: transglycosylase domain-containing protein, partial [Deltaproteobacteria bacterium]|nr:transglycosylase domain-containing protein [Deltaproteobacteria bacterium]
MAKHYLKKSIKIGLAAGVAMFLAIGGYLFHLNSSLPSVDALTDPDYSLPTIIYDRHGQKITEIFIKRRKLVVFSQLPPHLINGLIAKEDSRFFDHFGIDPLRMLKAAWVNALAWGTRQGASTLTQQTARQFFLTLEKTWERKLKEILLALKIERDFTKEEILTLYLNKVNFGDAWGVSAAAEYYFSKRVEDLTLAESAMLVGLLPAPNRYKPTRSPQLARQQRNIVLQRMHEEGFISRSQAMASASEPIILAEAADPTIEAVGYYVEHVRRLLLENYGSKSLYEGGLHVYTAMDITYQTASHKALVKGVRELDRRRGYRGAQDGVELNEVGQVPEEILESINAGHSPEVGKILKGIVVEVTDEEDKPRKGNDDEPPPPSRALVMLDKATTGVLAWKTVSDDWQIRLEYPDEEDAKEPVPQPIRRMSDILKPGDLIQVEVIGMDSETGQYSLGLFQEPQSNGALYAMSPHNGDVLAMSGGIRFGREEGGSEFIRATQALRQPGSSFKPMVYASAIEEGYNPATMLDDSPRVFILSTGKKHNPQNYDNTYLGPVSLRQSLVRSRNVPTVQLVEEIGASKVIEYARRFGLSTNIPAESIIALGTHSVRLSELTRAYGVFPAGGMLAKPRYILRIEDSKGMVIHQEETEMTEAISPATAFLVT